MLTDLPAKENPSYDVLAIDINERYLEETLGEDLSVSLVKITQEGEEKTELMAKEKYQELQSDLGEMLKGMQW